MIMIADTNSKGHRKETLGGEFDKLKLGKRIMVKFELKEGLKTKS